MCRNRMGFPHMTLEPSDGSWCSTSHSPFVLWDDSPASLGWDPSTSVLASR